MNTFKQDILKKITAGEVEMKPRWYFILQSLLLIVGVITATLVAVYLLSFVSFTLRQSGVGFIPLYGFRGVSQFVMSSPWLLIFFTGTFLSLLYLLVSRYSFSYKRPHLYSMIGVVVFVLLASFAIEQTVMHQRISQYSERHHLPLLAHRTLLQV